MKWNKIEDRLPGEPQEVIIALIEEGTDTRTVTWKHGWFGDYEAHEVKYWMALPDHPDANSKRRSL